MKTNNQYNAIKLYENMIHNLTIILKMKPHNGQTDTEPLKPTKSVTKTQQKIQSKIVMKETIEIINIQLLINNIWNNITKLYESINEKDLLLGLIANLSLNSETKKAIDFETEAEVMEAFKIYENLSKEHNMDMDNHMDMDMDMDNSMDFDKELWNNRSLLCLKQLCEWNIIYERIDDFIQSDNDTQTDDAHHLNSLLLTSINREKYLKYYFQSLIHTNKQTELSNLLNQISLNSSVATSTSTSTMIAMKQNIETNYTIELAISYYLQNEKMKSLNYIRFGIMKFLDLWLISHYNAKEDLLQLLNYYVELEDAILLTDFSQTAAVSCTVESFGQINVINENNNLKLMNNWKNSNLSMKYDSIWLFDLLRKQRQSILLMNVPLDTQTTDTSTIVNTTIAVSNKRTKLSKTAMIPTNSQTNNNNNGINNVSNNTIKQMNNYLTNLFIQTAFTGVIQKNLNVVKTQLDKSREYRLNNTASNLTMKQIELIYEYNVINMYKKIGNSTDINDLYGKTSLLLEKKLNNLMDLETENNSNNNNEIEIQNNNENININENEKRESNLINNSYIHLLYGKLLSNKSLNIFHNLSENELLINNNNIIKQSLFHYKQSINFNLSLNSLKSNEMNGQIYYNYAETQYKILKTYYEQLDTLIDENKDNNCILIINGNEIINNYLKGIQYNNTNCYERIMTMVHIVEIMFQFNERFNNPNTVTSTSSSAVSSTSVATSTAKKTSKSATVSTLKSNNSLKTINSIQNIHLNVKTLLTQQFNINELLPLLNILPAWLLIRNVSQLLGVLDLPQGVFAIHLLEKLALKYPKSIYYPFKITSERLNEIGKQRICNLQVILYDEISEQFIEALYGLHHPELRMKDELARFGEEYKRLDSNYKIINNELRESFTTIVRTYTTNQSWPKIGSEIGLYNKKCAKENSKIIDTIFGMKNEKFIHKTVLDTLRSKVSTTPKLHDSGKVDLNLFSEWLVNANYNKLRIEIPGQYIKHTNMLQPPEPDKHEWINSVDSKILVMSSMRKPKRIKFISSSGQERYFLVKGMYGATIRLRVLIEVIIFLCYYECNCTYC